MSLEGFRWFLRAMALAAAAAFVALYFVRAGYGMFRTASWGFSVGNRQGWMLMEAPVLVVMAVLWARSGAGFSVPVFVFFLLFQLHYLQRSFVFPFLMRGKGRMPAAILLTGAAFNVLNGMMQAGGLFYFAPPGAYGGGWAYFAGPRAAAGLLLFAAGMAVNLHSDHVVRCLRKPGDAGHYLPSRGLYRYVTSANYFGEVVEWAGFATLTASPAAWVFAWWTFANLAPRADAIRRRYREEFGEAVGKRKRIIPFIY